MLAALAVIFLLVQAGVTRACTADDMLDLIGSVEAPEGYNQVYSGVKLTPPMPITSMTVGEVLAWQSQASRTSVSSAAGRYQVIRATLEHQVTRGVVSLGDRFDENTQDRIGKALLADTGYSNGSTDPAVANRISGVWAALPRVTGARRGLSTYQGVAGNHALLSPESYEDFMACNIGLDAVERQASAVRIGLGIGLHIEELLLKLKDTSATAVKAFTDAAIWLLWTLFAVQLVMTVGRLIIAGEAIDVLVKDVILLFPFTLLLLVFITNFGPILDWTMLTATSVSNETLGLGDYSLGDLVRDRMVLFIRNVEATMVMSNGVYGIVIGVTILNAGVMAFQVGLVIMYYTKALIVLASSSLLLGAGALESTRGLSLAVLSRFVGMFLQLLAINLIMFITLNMTKDFSASSEIIARACLALALDIVAVVLMTSVPKTIVRMAVLH